HTGKTAASNPVPSGSDAILISTDPTQTARLHHSSKRARDGSAPAPIRFCPLLGQRTSGTQEENEKCPRSSLFTHLSEVKPVFGISSKPSTILSSLSRKARTSRCSTCGAWESGIRE